MQGAWGAAAGQAPCGTLRKEAEIISPCAQQRAHIPVPQPGERHPGTQQEPGGKSKTCACLDCEGIKAKWVLCSGSLRDISSGWWLLLIIIILIIL